jgi:hypothetical protein
MGDLYMEQKIDSLSENEEVWITNQLGAAANFVIAHSPTQAGNLLSLEVLDRAFANWIANGNVGEGRTVNEVINCVGVAFGQILVDGIGLKWVIATDHYGSELAVYGLPNTGDVLIYPVNFIAKRWERREINFIEASYQKIERQIRAIGLGYHR